LRTGAAVPREKVRNTLSDRERVIARRAGKTAFEDVITVGFFGYQL
jgi:hypothetical protein